MNTPNPSNFRTFAAGARPSGQREMHPGLVKFQAKERTAATQAPKDNGQATKFKPYKADGKEGAKPC